MSQKRDAGIHNESYGEAKTSGKAWIFCRQSEEIIAEIQVPGHVPLTDFSSTILIRLRLDKSQDISLNAKKTLQQMESLGRTAFSTVRGTSVVWTKQLNVRSLNHEFLVFLH